MSRTPPWYFVLGLIAAVTAWEFYRRLGHRRGMKTDPDGTWLKTCKFEPGRAYPIEFVLSAPSRDAGDEIATTLRSEGYDVVVDSFTDSPECEILATRSLVPDRDALVQVRERLVALAGKHGGSYEGWDEAGESKSGQ